MASVASSSMEQGDSSGVERGAGNSVARVSACPDDTEPAPSRIGLALSSGGARGFAHVGVIKGLRAAGYSIATVAGSSMGAIVGAGYAAQADVTALEQWVLDFRARDYSRHLLPIMDPARLTAFLQDALGEVSFADCAVPLRIVATDLRARAATTLDEGSVALAAFASSAMPFLHRPVPWGERLLADGSLSCVLPLPQATDDSVDLVIGSLVSRKLPALNGVASGLARAAGGAVRGWSRPYIEFFRERAPQLPWPAVPSQPAPPALILSPRLERLGPLDFGRVREAITAGEEAVAARLGEIQALLAGGRNE